MNSKHLFALAASTMLLSTPASATGNELLKSCKEALRALDNGENVIGFHSGACMGFVRGTRDTLMLINSSLSSNGRLCWPESGPTVSQAARIVVKYLDENPETLHRPQAELTILAFARAESPRVLRRLNTLRGLSHEQVEQVLARGA